jgi:VIT1/CCC1 family predicted Fe2+/Mn2+ transporter
MDKHNPGENHFSERIGWLRAAVLGANDGILSTASLMVGVASANTGRGAVLLAGVAGLAAEPCDGSARSTSSAARSRIRKRPTERGTQS